MTTAASRAAILTLLAAVMAATRLHHFATVPDASWAVFFVGGFYLHRWTRWAFPLLMALAVAIDWAVISGQGMDFFAHYCMSAAYWFLVPAYFTLWFGGMLVRRSYSDANGKSLAVLVASLFGAVVVCHLLSQGSFYWLSDSVVDPTLAGWWKNYTDWLLPYMRAAALYVGAAAMLHVLLTRLLPTPAPARALHAD